MYTLLYTSKQLYNSNSIKFKTVFGQKNVNFVVTAVCRKFSINLSHDKTLNKNNELITYDTQSLDPNNMRI